jgi:hypothetical protein
MGHGKGKREYGTELGGQKEWGRVRETEGIKKREGHRGKGEEGKTQREGGRGKEAEG